MDTTVRRSSSRVHTFIALTVLALVMLSGCSRAHSVQAAHNIRDIFIRQNGSSFVSSSTIVTSSSIVSTDSVLFSTITSSSIVSTQSSSTTSGSATHTTNTSSATFVTTSATSSTSTSSRSSIASSSRHSSTTTLQSSTLLPTSTRSSSTPTAPAPSTSSPISTSSSSTSQPQPATTFFVPGTFLQTSTTPALSDATSAPAVTTPTSAVSAAENASSFWSKKGAVAATFVIVSLVFLALAAFAVIAFLKRRSKRRENEIHEDMFENYATSEHRSNSPGPSINAAPMDAFASQYNFYGIGETRTAQSSSPVQHPDYYNQSSPARYISPSDALASQAAPTPEFRNPVGRASNARDSHPISIDSFYGAAGQPVIPGYAS